MFRINDFRPAFELGPHSVTVWGYCTADPLEQVLSRNYFLSLSSHVEPGALIYVHIRPALDFFTREPKGDPRTVLLMVCEVDRRRGETYVRLVQDFGPPNPDASTRERKRAA